MAKIAIGLIILAIALFFIKEYALKNNDEKKSNDETGGGGGASLDNVTMPPPPTPNINAATTGQPAQTILNTEIGEGKRVVDDYCKSLLMSKTLHVELKENEKVANELFPLTRQNVSEQIRKTVLSLSNSTKDSEIKLIPDFVDGGKFRRQLETCLTFCKTFEENAYKDGYFIDNSLNGMPSDFRPHSNLFLLNRSELDKCLTAYGACKGTANQKKDCINGNERKFWQRDFRAVIEKMIIETDIFGVLLRNYAIQELKKSGWKFSN